MTVSVFSVPAKIAVAPNVSGWRPIFAATAALLVVNAVATRAGAAVQQYGLGTALVSGLGFSWALWLSFAICLRLALKAPDRAIRRHDLWIVAGCIASALIPASPVSAVAATGLAIVTILNRDESVERKAAAMVLLAIAVQLLWSRLIMLVFVHPIANADAFLVGLITHTPTHGNAVQLVTGARSLSILEGCTSVQNASVALVLFVSIVRVFRPAPIRSELLYLAGAFLSVIVINTVRIAMMAQDEAAYHRIHGDTGTTLLNLIITVNGLAWAVMSVRREIFR